MASKYQIIVGMAEHTARDITQNPDIRDYNDFQTQLGNTDACLNQYVLLDCANQFTIGSKTTWTLSQHERIHLIFTTSSMGGRKYVLYEGVCGSRMKTEMSLLLRRFRLW